VRASYLQFAPTYLNVDENLEAVDAQIQSLDADLIVLPELFTSGYFFHSREDLAQVAEPIPGGRSTEALRDWAASLDATLVAGLPEREGDRFYRSGREIGFTTVPSWSNRRALRTPTGRCISSTRKPRCSSPAISDFESLRSRRKRGWSEPDIMDR